ncbi:MAG: TlpA family protein disulfide reductase [Chloroflexi bacterium]|nr:TlpA family protein disulfide reductase [Chloroflexota bacterium]
MSETAKTIATSFRWWRFGLSFALAAALGALAGYGVFLARGARPDAAPDFTVPLYTGGPGSFTLSDHRGHPVVLNFWASWCAPCRAEFPALQQVYDRYRDRGLVLFGVAVADPPRDSRAFLDEQQTTFPTGPDTTGKIAQDYGVRGLPVTVFINREGKVHKQSFGRIDEARLVAFVEELLGQ